MVIYVFCGICAIAVFLSILNPKQKFSDIMAVDEAAMLVHNGQGYQFKQGANDFFQTKTLADAKILFNSALSDSNQNSICKTSKGVENEEEIDLPESYDWRDAFPNCVQTVPSIEIGNKGNCSSGYAFSTLSAAEDRICMKSSEKV